MAPIGETNGYAHATAGAENKASNAAHNEDEVASLKKRYDYIRYGDNMKHDLFVDLLARYESLVKKHAEYVEAHQEERATAQQALMRAEGMQGSIDYLQRLLNRDPFLLVLVDGNGMIFHHNLLSKGEVGGQTAAVTIENAVLKWARTAIPGIPAETKVVFRIYADVSGVAEACTKAGLVDHPSRVEEFVHGFTSANCLFDFMDVGAGKGSVGCKVTESLKLYLYNYYCRHILLGCSHEDSYASFLHEYMHDPQAKGRITLLEGVPFGPELNALPLNMTKIPGIFRDSKLLLPPSLDFRVDTRSRLGSNHSLNAASSVFTPRTNTPITSPFGSTVSLDQAIPTRDDSRVGSRRSNSSETNPNSWATVTGKNAHRPIQNELPTKLNQTRPLEIQKNKHGQRIDRALDYDRDEVQRLKKLKACNQHYIGIGCCHYNAGKADKCPHNHHYNLSMVERAMLRVVARETPCKKGHECDDPKCIYGHQCPFPTASEGSMRGSGVCLNGEACRFPMSMHGMDLAPVKPIKYTKITGL